MNGLIILISMFFVAFIIFKMIKNKIIRFILTPTISILYGLMLFFIGMGISGLLYIILAVIPIIIGILFIIQLYYK